MRGLEIERCNDRFDPYTSVTKSRTPTTRSRLLTMHIISFILILNKKILVGLKQGLGPPYPWGGPAITINRD